LFETKNKYASFNVSFQNKNDVSEFENDVVIATVEEYFKPNKVRANFLTRQAG